MKTKKTKKIKSKRVYPLAFSYDEVGILTVEGRFKCGTYFEVQAGKVSIVSFFYAKTFHGFFGDDDVFYVLRWK